MILIFKYGYLYINIIDIYNFYRFIFRFYNYVSFHCVPLCIAIISIDHNIFWIVFIDMFERHINTHRHVLHNRFSQLAHCQVQRAFIHTNSSSFIHTHTPAYTHRQAHNRSIKKCRPQEISAITLCQLCCSCSLSLSLTLPLLSSSAV